MNDCKAALSVSTNDLKIYQHNEQSERQKYKVLVNSLQESHSELLQKTEQLKEINMNLNHSKQKLIELKQQMEQKVKEEQMLDDQLKHLIIQINEGENTIGAMKSNNKTLDILMKQKMKGTIPGILGRLVISFFLY